MNAQLSIKKPWKHCVAVSFVRNSRQCISTTPYLGREPGANDFESKALAIVNSTFCCRDVQRT